MTNLDSTNMTDSKTYAASKEEAADAMNKVLRGEVSALESYSQVMEKDFSSAEMQRLQEFVTEHRNIVHFWTKEVRLEAGQPDLDSGAWGTFVKAFTGSAKLFGNTAALEALRQGELHGLSQYQDLLESEFIDVFVKEKIRKEIIPALERHINTIDAMKKMQ